MSFGSSSEFPNSVCGPEPLAEKSLNALPMIRTSSVAIRPRNERAIISNDGKLNQVAWNSESDDGRTADSPHNPIPIPKATARMVIVLAKTDRSLNALLLHLSASESKSYLVRVSRSLAFFHLAMHAVFHVRQLMTATLSFCVRSMPIQHTESQPVA